MWQQGDVIIELSTRPIEGEKRSDCCLAEGEATGHFHRVEGAGVAVYGEGDERSFEAPEGATVTHDEHEPITLPPGIYRTRRVREYDHFAEEARSVSD